MGGGARDHNHSQLCPVYEEYKFERCPRNLRLISTCDFWLCWVALAMMLADIDTSSLPTSRLC